MTTERKMGPRGFLQKANRASASGSAAGFLAAHREYLVNSEVSYATKPLIVKLDAGEAFPSPTLNAIREAVMGHIMLVDLLKAKESAEKAEKAPKTRKPFTACVRDGSGAVLVNEEGKEIRQSFDLPQRAQDWCDRRLLECAPECFGEIVHNTAHNPNHATDLITRDEAMARLFKTPRTPVMKAQKQSQSKLGFGVKAHPSVAKFSHG
jgi:hypothetical protein